jgi:hypothetical protein
VGQLFVNQFDRVKIEFLGEAKSFGDGEEALRYVVSEK